MTLQNQAANTANFSTIWLLGLCLALIAGTSACSTLRGTPARYAPTSEIVKSIQLTSEDIADLQKEVDSRSERNRLQNKAIAVIDLQFHQFVRDLAANRSDSSTAAAGISLGSSTAGAFVDSVKAKTNYAIFAAGVIGTFGIVDRNYYYEKTVPALVAAMGSARASVLVKIKSSQIESISTYDGSAALADLEEYYSAGTLLAGIADVTARANSEKQESLDEVRLLEAPTDDEIERRSKIRDCIFSITEQQMPDAQKVILALGLEKNEDLKETRLTLLRELRPPTPARISRVEKALKDSGLLH